MSDRRSRPSKQLGIHAVSFRVELARLGYADRPAEKHLELLADLDGWLESEGLAPGELTAARVAEFLCSRRTRGHRRLITSVGFEPLFGYLVRAGVVPPPTRPAPVGPLEMSIERYRNYLASERGLVDGAVEQYMTVARAFARAVGDGERIDWAAVLPADVSRFVSAPKSFPSWTFFAPPSFPSGVDRRP